MRWTTIALVLACLAAEVGQAQQHPDVALPDLDGKIRRISEFRGKKLLLFNFASW